MSGVDQQAKIIWDYMLVHDEIKPADIELYNQKLAPKVLITGGRGKLTDSNQATEAETFAAIMYAAGVPEEHVMIENKATNTGDNVRFSKELLSGNRSWDMQKDIPAAIIVTKPYMERRAKATFAQLWPELQARVTSQQISYEDYMNQAVLGKGDSINVMVGDLQRIIEYPAKKWMAPQIFPESVKAAYNYLISHGYDKQLA